jgi:copper homeostasis protein
MRRVIDAADGLHVTFHRAFDQVRNPFEAMDRLAEIGVARILTSGGRADVIQGAATLRKWVERADGRLEIMPGGGIRVENLPDLHRAVGARSYHASLQAPLASETADSASSEGVTDPELVRRAKEILRRPRPPRGSIAFPFF